MSYAPVQYKAKDYSHLKGLHAISDDQIAEHLKLYNGYVTRTNAMMQRIAEMANDGKHAESIYQELKRRLGWECNGMRLHEYYFDNLKPRGAGKLDAGSALRRRGGEAVRRRRRVEGRPAGRRQDARRRLGHHLLGRDGGQLLNQWIDRHDEGTPRRLQADRWCSTCGSTRSASTSSRRSVPSISKTSSQTSTGTRSRRA